MEEEEEEVSIIIVCIYIYTRVYSIRYKGRGILWGDCRRYIHVVCVCAAEVYCARRTTGKTRRGGVLVTARKWTNAALVTLCARAYFGPRQLYFKLFCEKRARSCRIIIQCTTYIGNVRIIVFEKEENFLTFLFWVVRNFLEKNSSIWKSYVNYCCSAKIRPLALTKRIIKNYSPPGIVINLIFFSGGF